MLIAVLLFNIAICCFLITILVSMLHTRKKNLFLKEICNFLILSLVFNFFQIIVRVGSFLFEYSDLISSSVLDQLFVLNGIIYFGSRASLAIFFKNVHTKFNTLETKKYILLILFFQLLFFFISITTSNKNLLIFLTILFHFLGCYWELYELKRLKKFNRNTFINWTYIVIFFEAIALLFLLTSIIFLNVTNGAGLFTESLSGQPFVTFKGALITVDLIIFVLINAFLFDQVYELSRRTTDENILIKNLLIQQTSLTDAIQKSNKFIVSGALSASIAHELSHPLASIQANSEILTMQLTSRNLLTGDIQLSATKILRDTQRAGQTLKALKSLFSVKKELLELNINDVIRLCLDLVSSTMTKENILLKMQLDESVPTIMANPQELQQVLLNLLNNSIQAIQKHHKNVGEIAIKTFVEGSNMVLTIADNGNGFSIDQEINIFELLRSTKKEGMGFGLWLSKFILEKNFGNIELINSPGIGAKFIIKLPIYEPSPLSGDNTSFDKLS